MSVTHIAEHASHVLRQHGAEKAVQYLETMARRHLTPNPQPKPSPRPDLRVVK